MKKLFVSVPMKGRTEEAIKKSIDDMKSMAEIIFGEEFELIDTYITDPAPEVAHKNVWCLGRSIQLLADADAFMGISGSAYYNGCNVEASVAGAYDIPMMLVSIRKVKSLEDAYENEKKFMRFNGQLEVKEAL